MYYFEVINYVDMAVKPRFNNFHIFSGDVRVIAALGDSIVTGTGSLASDITQVSQQFRGVSFATGK